MGSAKSTTRRLLATGLTGLSLLMTPGCGLAPKMRQEPDHVFSTTTPQMFEQEASDQPIPARAHYPEESSSGAADYTTSDQFMTASPQQESAADGVVRLSGRRPSPAPGILSASPAKGPMSIDDVAKPDTFQLVSFQAEEFAPAPPGDGAQYDGSQGDGSQFIPAEPRLECDPNGIPLHRMETIAASPLADLYPDEYVFDGGDRETRAAMHTSQRSGLDTEDTVAAFMDHTGSARTAASNRVAVYAPRFGSVRTVTGLLADTKIDKASGAKDSITVGNLKTGNAAQESVHDTTLYGLETRDRLDGMKGSTPPMQSRRTEAAGQNSKVDEGHEGRAYSSSDTFNRRDRLEMAQLRQNAIAWTRDDFPVINITTINASDISAKLKVQQTVGVEDERETRGNIHIVKLADRELAQSGETVTFTIRFENTGDFDVYDVQIVDNLTPRLDYVTGSASIDAKNPGEVSVEPNGEGSSILTFTLDNPLKGHASGTITFEAIVK